MEEREIVKKNLTAILGMMSAEEIAELITRMCIDNMELEDKLRKYELTE